MANYSRNHKIFSIIKVHRVTLLLAEYITELAYYTVNILNACYKSFVSSDATVLSLNVESTLIAKMDFES